MAKKVEATPGMEMASLNIEFFTFPTSVLPASGSKGQLDAIQNSQPHRWLPWCSNVQFFRRRDL